MSVRAVFAVVLLALFPAAAHAESRTGTLTDPAGDSTAAGADLTGVDVAYDTTGDVTATVRFAAVPTDADAFVVVSVGEPATDGSCSARFLVGTFAAGTTADAAWGDGTDTGPGTATRNGATLTLAASDYRLAGDNTCFKARLTHDSATLDDAGSAALAGAASPSPTPGATATPEPTATPDPVPPKPKATALERYDAALRACAKKPKSKRKGCRARAARTNKPGAKLAAKRRTNPLIGRVYLQFQVDVAGLCGGACIESLAFSDDKLVYSGVNDDGPALARCTKATATGDDDGCRRYTYSRAKRTLTVGGTTYRLAKDAKTFAEGKDGLQFTRVGVPRAGLRIAVPLESLSSFGIPGNQTFSSSELTLVKDGRFVLASAVAGFYNQGSDFASSFTALPADRRGKYAFEPGGMLALFFDNGRISRRTATTAFGENGKTPDAERDGLFLNGNFYHPPDDD